MNMPRVQTSTAGRISEFFRGASIEVAEFALQQIQDILRDRRARSKAAKDRAAGSKKPAAVTASAAAATRVVKPAVKKKSHKKKKPQPPAVAASTTADVPLPLQDTYAGEVTQVTPLQHLRHRKASGDMDDPIPFIIYGDGPRLPSGLARIARDLTARLVGLQEELGIRVAQVGVDWPGGWHWQGWDFCGFQPSDRDQGREAIASVVDELTRETGKRPIVWMFMDPSRCYDLTRQTVYDVDDPLEGRIPVDFWGYFPIDAHNQQGGFGGPAQKAVSDCQRVMGYGRYGALVLKHVLGEAHLGAVSYLPHGIETRVFRPGIRLDQAEPDFHEWARTVPPETIKIGCVATNQARKDLGLLFSSVAQIKALGHPVALWLHTDKLTHIWDVGELVMTCGLRREEVAASTEEITDTQLAARYCWSDVTIAPGLGEGFGYPIVESLACGTPVIHGKYAGGVELIPEPSWLVEPSAWRLESLYAVQRPVFHPKAFAEAVVAVTEQERAIGTDAHRAYCAGAVSYLDWECLWPRWRSWITKGLQEARDGRRRASESL